MEPKADSIADARPGGWVDARAPATWRPWLRLARYDRPIGFWLLAIPCWAGMALAHAGRPWSGHDAVLAVAFWVGALAMRGAGCTYNDIVDRDLDAQVARTALRPVASGRISVRAAWVFVLAQALIGLLVLVILPPLARLVALASLPLIFAYPFMKRITFWPQAWLGLTFNWGVPVGYVAIAGAPGPALLTAYAGLFFWTLGYDTIYAHQDREDDALIGIKSTARLFGRHTRLALVLIYSACVLLLALAGWLESGGDLKLAVIPVLVFGLFLVQQARTTDFDHAQDCLRAFKQNKWAGLAYVLALAALPCALPPALAWVKALA